MNYRVLILIGALPLIGLTIWSAMGLFSAGSSDNREPVEIAALKKEADRDRDKVEDMRDFAERITTLSARPYAESPEVRPEDVEMELRPIAESWKAFDETRKLALDRVQLGNPPTSKVTRRPDDSELLAVASPSDSLIQYKNDADALKGWLDAYKTWHDRLGSGRTQEVVQEAQQRSDALAAWKDGLGVIVENERNLANARTSYANGDYPNALAAANLCKAPISDEIRRIKASSELRSTSNSLVPDVTFTTPLSTLATAQNRLAAFIRSAQIVESDDANWIQQSQAIVDRLQDLSYVRRLKDSPPGSATAWNGVSEFIDRLSDPPRNAAQCAAATAYFGNFTPGAIKSQVRSIYVGQLQNDVPDSVDEWVAVSLLLNHLGFDSLQVIRDVRPHFKEWIEGKLISEPKVACAGLQEVRYKDGRYEQGVYHLQFGGEVYDRWNSVENLQRSPGRPDGYTSVKQLDADYSERPQVPVPVRCASNYRAARDGLLGDLDSSLAWSTFGRVCREVTTAMEQYSQSLGAAQERIDLRQETSVAGDVNDNWQNIRLLLGDRSSAGMP